MMNAAKQIESDVVVVGGGGSGLASAVEAASLGADVTVIETADVLRGSTGLSVGSIAAAGTPDQARLGIRDTSSRHFDDYQIISGDLARTENPDLVRLLVDNVADTIAWLRSMGIEFFGPVGEPPHSVPRLHNVLPGSRSYIYHLERRARKLGVNIVLNVTARRLLTTDAGRVRGTVCITRDNRSVTFLARKGVILAAGDFSANQALKCEWINKTVSQFVPINVYANGDAQTMGMNVGGQILNADVFDVPSMRLAPPRKEGLYGLLQRLPPSRALTGLLGWGLRNLPDQLIRTLIMGFVTTYLSPSEALFDHGAILVDRDGRLHASTDTNINIVVARLGEAGGYIIGDRKLREIFSRAPNYVATAPGVAHAYLQDFRRARRDVYFEAPTLEALANKIGVPAKALQLAVSSAKEAATAGPGTALDSAPYFALGPVRGYLIQTNGGLRVNSRLEVVRRDGRPIPGLYAVGNAGQGGLALFGHGHHLGWAFTSGRLAGRNVMADPDETDSGACRRSRR
jgi:succinate dehydrogenase/fumarate reductase flavoprotein subunit